jgi:hypothetical protein
MITEALVEEYLNVRDQRLVAKRQMDTLEKQESKLKDLIEHEMLLMEGQPFKGINHRVDLTPELKPTVEDWGLLNQYILQTGSFDLYQKRLTESAVKGRWEDGVNIPGVAKFPIYKLSITKA